MYNVLAVTNRHLCKSDFLEQIKKICLLNQQITNDNRINSNLLETNTNTSYNNLKDINSISILLREKDLSEDNYEKLAVKVIKICEEYNTECILHTYFNTAKKLAVRKIHLPLSVLKNNQNLIYEFDSVGVSIHSLNDAVEAQKLGTSYMTAGHIFATDCKKGIPGRGLSFLENVINHVDIPVFAIGGISSSNIKDVIKCGASGICIMSGLMNIAQPEDFF
ncbi:thiamine phosphate synthase [uncultured Clostridium sp.]|uniref:thiamine phosphate synthase n=1 Tax=uncultured Clostridium sp. TaxID=59620 RepID=UPI0025F6CCB0|nr:thiamine phosphate synthase [uncultured Clostridium sp.]